MPTFLLATWLLLQGSATESHFPIATENCTNLSSERLLERMPMEAFVAMPDSIFTLGDLDEDNRFRLLTNAELVSLNIDQKGFQYSYVVLTCADPHFFVEDPAYEDPQEGFGIDKAIDRPIATIGYSILGGEGDGGSLYPLVVHTNHELEYIYSVRHNYE